ncbi:MAG: hypothetical protein ACI8WY_003686, partial [Planctomycetota bacterium]
MQSEIETGRSAFGYGLVGSIQRACRFRTVENSLTPETNAFTKKGRAARFVRLAPLWTQ